MRIWREWLAAQCKLDFSAGFTETAEAAEERILWADNDKAVGLKLRVVERQDEPAPVMVQAGEDLPVSYTLQYEGIIPNFAFINRKY